MPARYAKFDNQDQEELASVPLNAIMQSLRVARQCAGINGKERSLVEIVLDVEGMHCGSCSAAVQGALEDHVGVTSADVNLLMHTAAVRYDAHVTSVADIVGAVEECGFHAAVQTRAHRSATEASVRLAVDGMHCASCKGAVQGALEDVPGVLHAEVNLLLNVASVRYDPNATGPRALIDAVQDAGFDASLEAPGDALAGDEGDRAAHLYLQRLSAALTFTVPVVLLAKFGRGMDAQFVGFPLDELLKWILTTPIQFVVGADFHTGALAALRRGAANMDVLVSLGTTASYLYSVISILHHHFNLHHLSGDYVPTDFFEGAAMLITFVLLGKYIEARAKRHTSSALRALMDLAPDTAVLITVDPQSGHVLSEREIDGRLVQSGDMLKLLPGCRVPADGELVEGETYMDEHMLTGESAPVRKQAGDGVVGGTLNAGGAARMRATRTGEDTVLASITRLVADAQLRRAPVQAFADRVSAFFVPIVCAVAAATTLAWWLGGLLGCYPRDWVPRGHSVFLFALLFGIAVLCIACPCALGLATPTAVMVGTGVGASQGIIIKGGDALERGSNVSAVVFDKTGTLTRGKPEVVAVRHMTPARGSGQGRASGDAGLTRLATLVGSLELQSEHPVARAVVQWAATTAGYDEDGASAHGRERDREWAAPVCDVDARAGRGVTGRVGARRARSAGDGAASGAGPAGEAVAIGNRALMDSLQVPMDEAAAAEPWIRGQEDRGCTVLFVSVDGCLELCLSVADPVKPEARGVVSRLVQSGVEVHMMTGDNWRTARAIAEQLGIVDFAAEVRPEEKEAAVRRLQGGRAVVAMVGDGVNDAPALAAADLGIAVGSGTEVAVETADFVLVRSDLEDVVVALDLARATFRRIQANFVWAMGYNVLMIPIAAGALYPLARFQLPPAFAGLAMAFSSISVVLSSLQLRWYRRPKGVLRDYTRAYGGLLYDDGKGDSPMATSSVLSFNTDFTLASALRR